jgi:hypothetical protein
MDVLDAIREAEALLPGEPVEEGTDARWQAIIRIGEFVQADPEPIWDFILRWGTHPQEDLRAAVATCLLEHLLEYHFATYFALVEKEAVANPLFADTVQRCWPFGSATDSDNVERFNTLAENSRKKKP